MQSLDEVGLAACRWVGAAAGTNGLSENRTYNELLNAVEEHAPSSVRLAGLAEIGRLAVIWFDLSEKRDQVKEQAAYQAMLNLANRANRLR